MVSDIESIIRKAEDTLVTAQFGLDDLKSGVRARRQSSIRNVVVFGRSVTFVLQNLKSKVGESAFQNWYSPIQEGMKVDLVMKYFVTLRNEILKQGKLPLSVSATVNLQPGDMEKLGPGPPGAKSFFIGDQLGGCGWEIEMPDGSTEKYYVEVPNRIAMVKQYFSELPVPADHGLASKSVEELCKYYLLELEKIVDSARLEFLKVPTQKVGKIRLPPYLRLVK